ncbi:MAG: stage II sporulation protein M [Dermatophilaceae bacterium]
MDLDAFVAAHRHEWARLEALVSGRGRKLSGAEGDELLELYQRTATHLSEVRSTTPEPTIVAHLSSLLARARSKAVGTRTLTWADVVRFFVETFPAALYAARRWWLATMAANILVAFAVGWWFYANPQLESSLASPAEIQRLVTHDFESYYSEYAAGSFAVKIWTNNAWVSALCIAFGVFGVPVIWLLWNNIANAAVIGALMWRYDRAWLFFGLILPHGLLELTAVFVAGGVGLRIFWGWVDPGPRTRLTAVAQEGRAAMSVALGLVVVLFVTGVIEAFVTPSPLPTWARIGIGCLAEAAFFVYVFTLGRYAARRGRTGDLAAADRGDAAPMLG